MRSITAFARLFAAHAATFRFADCTESETSGFWPFFAMFPETAFVEIPGRNLPTRVLHSVATRPSIASECAIVPTVLGFVCSDWSATLPLEVYGWPRYSVADALNVCAPRARVAPPPPPASQAPPRGPAPTPAIVAATVSPTSVKRRDWAPVP